MVRAAGPVELVDDISGAVRVDLPVGFVNLDGGKTRFANDPAMAYLSRKMMVGSVMTLDDTWQGASMPHAREHYGQIMLVHELVQGGTFAPLLVPKRPKDFPYMAPPPMLAPELLELSQRAPSPFSTPKTAAVIKVRGPRRGWHEGMCREELHVSLVDDATARELDAQWTCAEPSERQR